MNLLTLFLTSIGLSMDACAVSISNGMCYSKYDKKDILLTAFAFGFFQAMMPLLGFLAGSIFSEAVLFLDHWIALILLSIIGGKMIYEAIKEFKCPEVCLTGNKGLTSKTLILQAIATSIDAFAVGIGFAVMKVNILSAVLFIGIITFITSFIGSHLGKKCGEMFKQKAEILGGAILIFIGIKIFLEHTLG